MQATMCMRFSKRLGYEWRQQVSYQLCARMIFRANTETYDNHSMTFM